MTSRPRATNTGKPSGNMIRDSALGLVPETLGPYMELNRIIWEEGPLSPAEIEIARLRNARKVNCVFCKSVRYDIAKADGLSEDRVNMIQDGFRDSDLSHREKLILAFTDQFLTDPGDLEDSLKAQLLAEFSRQELVHLSMVVAHFSGFSRCAVSLGGMPDELPIMEISVPR